MHSFEVYLNMQTMRNTRIPRMYQQLIKTCCNLLEAPANIRERIKCKYRRQFISKATRVSPDSQLAADLSPAFSHIAKIVFFKLPSKNDNRPVVMDKAWDGEN